MNYIRKKILEFELNPPAVLAVGFGSLILLGAILLNLPIATQSGESIGFINALFTSASSVCVTGLVVVNTAEFWSLFGQVVIIVLIQMGGLGFMTMATVVALVLGKKIRLKERLIIKEQLNQESMSGLVRLTKYVIYVTFAIELVGAILLSIRFIPIYGLGKGIWFSIFHAISAFCNAGFDIIGNNMVPFVGDNIVNLTIAALIILGGLGFSVYADCYRNKKFNKLSLHSKLVITITAILLILGTVLFFIIEHNNPLTLDKLSLQDKVLASFFQSTVTRTAGFNSVNLEVIEDTSAFLMIILMFIGGSPGSTAGGIKTTTFGTIVLSTMSTIKGEKDVEVFNRRISDDIVKRSLSIVTISLTWIAIVSFILTLTEEAGFLELLFETTSAFATVGLTRGVTPNLSNIGKLIISLTMYIGRVGPLTMAFAFKHRRTHKQYRNAEGNIIVG
ncbi:TrkH family potassium uptake protein [Wansuia hejianensis]|uniref:TrkH family potassium uptake protein n=1 Tax=Wansuia hejianensis TaxID=2763667 RepID=A0A926INA6_9FIRM|nr:TrkH family potassium uptake protein [Wansuia hejianensis]MBC8591270.1 TrkH family potassium uptake protein [Wansuia hejianensis]